MTKLAKTYGLSDVGLRKICVKYNIPTPPIGYWAKRAHGKSVRQPSLPPQKSPHLDTIDLVSREVVAVPADVLQEQDVVRARDSGFPPIVVPAERPPHLHKAALTTARALKAAREDHEGLRTVVVPDGVAVSVGSASIDRAVRIIDALAGAAELRGYHFEEHKDGIRIVVDGVPIAWRLHEIKDKAPYVPTKRELEVQAQREEDRKRWPSLYSSNSNLKAYASWDYSPSGRLSLTFTDATRFYWGGDGRVGNWRDRKNAPLDTYLDDAMRALALGAVDIKRRLAEEAEQERRREDEQERRRREQARKERIVKRHEYLLKKADDFARYRKVRALAEHLEREARTYGSREPVDHLIDELTALTEVMGAGLGREELGREIAGLGLYAEGDLPQAGEASGDDV
ncbi:MAG: hypothetical protein IT566_18240 [Rhodospirillaceae bacterium]|nr:hypothetical protein [Rhodospirillaceae bacterium]